LKRIAVFLLILCMLCGTLSSALADTAGALAEGELSAWLNQLLLDTRDLQPLNAPVGEESLTEEGYAFLYDFATLYYDKPVLDASSRLRALSITSPEYAAPRGITLGADEWALLTTFGWQNPYLMGDGVMAAFYTIDDLPRCAYWSWATHDENWWLTSVQCAVHVRVGDDSYTDVNLLFELEDAAVTGIRLTGLDSFVTVTDVIANLDAVLDVQQVLDEHE